MSISSPILSLLGPLIANPFIMDAANAGANAFAREKFAQRNSAITFQTGHGITRHCQFNEGFAAHLKRVQRRSRIQFFPSRKKATDVIGDVIIVDPFRGQQRVSALLNKKRYQFLHMSGEVKLETLKLEVYKPGKCRLEYCKNQSSRVRQPAQPDLFNPEPDNFDLVTEDDNPVRVIIVTEICGPRKDKVKVWLVLPTKNIDLEGTIQLAEAELLFEIPISGTRASVSVTRKTQDDMGIAVTKKDQVG